MIARQIRDSLVAVVVAALILSVSGCGTFQNRLEHQEIALGTHSSLGRGFHIAVEDPQGAGFRFPVVLFGIEKAKREVLGVPDLVNDPFINHLPGVIDDSTTAHERKRIETQRSTLERILDDGKRTFISHVIDYKYSPDPIPQIKAHFVYDAYGADCRRGSTPTFQPKASLYANSWAVIAEVKKTLQARIKAAPRPYTHLIFGTMGWNTAQLKGIRNLNSIFSNLLLAAEDAKDQEFRPLFVALTWPSKWNIPIVSYANKANDADEIGFLWANAIINTVLTDLRDERASSNNPLPVIVIGHSFGARMVTRAAFSGAVLTDSRPLENGADLVIGLQGAFSIHRFLKKHDWGQEGYPYANYASLRGRVALTWSSKDSANPVANWITLANHAGAKSGYKRAKESKYNEHFQFLKAPIDGTISSAQYSQGKSILYIDASDLVRYRTSGSGGNAHSDIYNRDMGRLLWSLIASLS